MSRIRAPLLVGLLGVAAAVVFVLLYGTVQKQIVKKGEGYRVYADFEDVSGLAGHSRVTISGIPVGAIDEIELITGPAGMTRARVWVRLGGEISLYKGLAMADGRSVGGATITRRTATMLGDYYLDVAPGAGGDRLANGDAIPNVVGDAGIMAIANRLEKGSDILPRLQQIADDVKGITGTLNAALGGPKGEARVQQVVDDLVRSAESIAGAAKDIREFVGHEVGPTGTGRLDRILNNIERVSGDASRVTSRSATDFSDAIRNIKVISEELRKMVSHDQDGKLGGAVDKLQESLSNLQAATGHVNSIAQKLDQGQGTLGKLINNDEILKKADTVVSDLGGLVSSVSRLKTEVAFRSEFNIYQRALKNYVGLKFQPEASKYYLIELVFDPRGKTSTTERVVLTNDPRVPGAVTERITETKTGVKFSFQFAKRLFFVGGNIALTGRFGFIESTGGIGGDLDFLKDTLKISADLFDFSADTYPRLKAFLRYTFLDNFYVAAGVDDVLNKRGRDYFVSAGFQFRDDDIKALLFTAPMPSF